MAEIKTFDPASYHNRCQTALAVLRMYFSGDDVDNLMLSIIMTNEQQSRWAELIEQAADAADAGANLTMINELFSA